MTRATLTLGGLAADAARLYAPLMPSIQETLRRVFGLQEFRPHQREIIEHLIGGGDAFDTKTT